jgi:hypothetical protein
VPFLGQVVVQVVFFERDLFRKPLKDLDEIPGGFGDFPRLPAVGEKVDGNRVRKPLEDLLELLFQVLWQRFVFGHAASPHRKGMGFPLSLRRSGRRRNTKGNIPPVSRMGRKRLNNPQTLTRVRCSPTASAWQCGPERRPGRPRRAAFNGSSTETLTGPSQPRWPRPLYGPQSLLTAVKSTHYNFAMRSSGFLDAL